HGAENFVDAESRLQITGDCSPQRTCTKAYYQRQWNENQRWQVLTNGNRDSRHRDRADEKLAFCADVYHTAAKRDTNADCDQQQGYRAGDGVVNPAFVT